MRPSLLTASLGAQIARDDWVVSTFSDFISPPPAAIGGLWHVDAAMTTTTLLTNQTPNMVAANAVVIDEDGFVFYATFRTASIPVPNPCEIFQVLVAGGAVVTETRLTTAGIDQGSVSAITLRRNQIWFVTDAGNVGWIPKAGGAATIVLNLQSLGVLGLGQSIATNGREIFVGTSHTATTPDPANVWSFDAESATPTLTQLAFLGGSAFAMDLARNGQVLVGRVSGRLYMIDPLVPNQTPLQINVGATAPQSNSNGTAINPWSNLVGNVPGYGSTTRVIGFYDVASNTWPVQLNLNTAVPSGVASAHEQPFFLFGRGCLGANGLEPRVGWSGMPMQGQTFTVTLRNGDMTPGIALLLFGLSDTAGPIGPLPTDLSFLGAFGCKLYVSMEATQVSLLVNGAGSGGLSVPINPSLVGFKLFAQWAVASTVNPFGFVTSDAVAVQLR